MSAQRKITGNKISQKYIPAVFYAEEIGEIYIDAFLLITPKQKQKIVKMSLSAVSYNYKIKV